MSRSGYSEECENIELYRRTVENAINGRRGQAFLRELLAALDALPQPRLIEGELQTDGEVCAIGSVGLRRGVDMSKIDIEDPCDVADAFRIPRCLAAEIEFINDDDFRYETCGETPEERFKRVRAWVVSQLATDSASGGSNG